MLTIQKLEKGYGAFEGERLAVFVDRQEDYAGLVNTVITVNTKLEIERIKPEIKFVKEKLLLFHSADLMRYFCKLNVRLQWLENYNV